jgi:serine/threonine-protein kinase SRPK3
MSDSETDTTATSESSDYVDDDINDHFQGMTLNGKYILLHKIGYGAFSTVWLAYHILDPNKVFYYAIKIQNPEDHEDAMVEVRTMTRLKRFDCPFILQLKDHFEFNPPDNKEKTPSVCMVFDLMACSLYQLIRKGKYTDGLPAKIVLRIAHQVLTALKHMHDNKLVHTDIKPENLLIKGRDARIQQVIDKVDQLGLYDLYQRLVEEEKVRQNCPSPNKDRLKKIKKVAQEALRKRVVELMEPITDAIIDSSEKVVDVEHIETVLSDFGTVYEVDELEPDSCIQTRYYMSPEVILQCGCDQRCDLWSVGCMLYELLTGDILFDPEKDRERSRDFHHIYWINQVCGDFPEGMIQRSKKRREFFDKKGKILGKRPERFPLREIIQEYCVHDKHTTELEVLMEIICSLLRISPRERPTINDTLQKITPLL